MKVYGIFRRGVLVGIPAPRGADMLDIGYAVFSSHQVAKEWLDKRTTPAKRSQYVIEEIEIKEAADE
jgi:hypothetical protein